MDILVGSTYTDDRGIVTFCNDFDFKDVKRFYMVQNHKAGFVRAWHGHRKEGKYVFVPKGAVLIAVKPMESTDQEIEQYTITGANILYIPPGYYNGFQTLTDDTQVMFFSSSTLEDSKDDDIREPALRWDIWKENWR